MDAVMKVWKQVPAHVFVSACEELNGIIAI